MDDVLRVETTSRNSANQSGMSALQLASMHAHKETVEEPPDLERSGVKITINGNKVCTVSPTSFKWGIYIHKSKKMAL